MKACEWHKEPNDQCADCLQENSFTAPACSAVGGDFYKGVEWLACWLLDNAEGETITEEQLRPWAVKAWEAHLKRQNAPHEARRAKGVNRAACKVKGVEL